MSKAYLPAEQQCHQCHEHAHRYRCPACDMRTCSLACTKAHKQEKACTGKRSRTEMVTLSDFTERQLLSDYKFLEEAARLHDVAQRSEAPRPARQLPLGLQNFVDEVRLPPYASLLSIICWVTLAAAHFPVYVSSLMPPLSGSKPSHVWPCC